VANLAAGDIRPEVNPVLRNTPKTGDSSHLLTATRITIYMTEHGICELIASKLGETIPYNHTRAGRDGMSILHESLLAQASIITALDNP
jgi:hypothetical protein